MLIYHCVLYWKTARSLGEGDSKQAYVGSAALRILLELTVVLGAFTLLVDATVGYRTTIFDDWPVIVQYFWVTAVPLGSVLAHYLLKLQKVLQVPVAAMQPRHLMPLWLWTLALPLPGLLYSYVLINQTRVVFIGLLLVVALCKTVTELVYYFKKAEPLIQLQATDPTVLEPSVFSPNALLNQLWAYVIILVAFFAVNPFTHDPRYSLVGNALIYFGFVLAAGPLAYRVRRVLRFDRAAKQIVIESGWVRRRQRSIALADIIAITVKRNGLKLPYRYDFTVRQQKPWRCSAGPFQRQQWLNWIQLLQTHCSDITVRDTYKN